MNAERQTEYRPIWLLAGSAVVAAGAVMLAVAVSDAGATGFLALQLAESSLGWAPPLMVLQNGMATLGIAVSGQQPG
ncbi:MAG TPA: hypothetical protein VFB81_21480, partial [Myxococcales bacterium]|nr:hypothetical protein [Myxococcales bacterium]